MKLSSCSIAAIKRQRTAALHDAIAHYRRRYVRRKRVSVLECGGPPPLSTWKKLRCGLRLFILVFSLAGAAVSRAQTNNLTSLLQQGLLEEQANGNLDAAIADYRSLALEFDKDRQLAATAVFRLGECYRAQGKTNEAAAQYRHRILREFPEMDKLATMSRQNV